jgi:hypothetical protein
MKKILTGIILILFLTQCSEKKLEFESTLVLNDLLISHTSSLWKDAITMKDSFTEGRVNQFNKDMSLFYEDGRSNKEFNPFYYHALTLPYYHGNGKMNSSVLKGILQQNKIQISDSLSFNKKLSFESDNSILLNSKIKITLYQIKYNNYYTWLIGKINHNEEYNDDEGFSMPIFSYKYELKNNRILSYLTCNINYEIEGHFSNFKIILNKIDVINDKIEYEDFTKEYLSNLSENLKNWNINVSYK